jgi:hypothetical protein
MTDGKSVVVQAHEIQCMAKELEHLKINLPDKFVAGGIIASCLLPGGILPLHSNTRGWRYQYLI